ncbi:NAD(P)-dependent alcohol dehydrogenase [Beijerinckia indica]|uniref:Alcohol dehydrogenase GroES domain protein n=1 Tax=Beijerinckia indica subsp. indica (strain ATCC 9039 / DSM 1715 / NCIMB 8712) TaxID=395963 RepID=B2IHR1_BEII9|nr:NAD(P)-dependent alcohol dehydrogenase [Beijerinckia indica]ACB95954.1 Alcohol dehydrogenase GroES domain protein [Beijerinckia indica subsp. indica ATCC 9039]
MQALVLERKGELSLRDVDLPLAVGPGQVKIAVHTVGICGSDVHYFTHGSIGPYIVEKPMVLGHEATGTIVEVGPNVSTLKVGDRVCMEPGVPDMSSRASKLGLYNVDPSVTFWATPPVHGVLTPYVVHPAAFTYKLPANVSFAEGALVEPFAIGMQAATRARIAPGDVAAVIGAGTIGIMTALAAVAGGCSRVFISDFSKEKLAIAGGYDCIVPVNAGEESLADVVARETENWGADVVFEASGSPKAYGDLFRIVRPGGAVVLVGLPVEPVAFDVSSAISKEVRIETVFRYANIFDRALALIASGKVNLKPLITGTFPFSDSVVAFERAAAGRPTDVKLQIEVVSENA